MATEALQVSCLLLPPPNRRRLQLLLRLMALVCHNPQLPPLNDFISTRTLVQLCTNRRVDDAIGLVADLGSALFHVCLDGADVLALRPGLWR